MRARAHIEVGDMWAGRLGAWRLDGPADSAPAVSCLEHLGMIPPRHSLAGQQIRAVIVASDCPQNIVAQGCACRYRKYIHRASEDQKALHPAGKVAPVKKSVRLDKRLRHVRWGGRHRRARAV